MEQPKGPRGAAVPRQGEGGFDEAWYPVARSAELAAGTLLGADYLDGRVVAFRGESGRVAVLSAYCRHLGADLSVGKVVGDSIRCAFHHWCYGQDGTCVAIPSGDAIPDRARLYRFPAVEALGLVWAYNGPEEQAPQPPRFVRDESELALRVTELPPHPVDPWTLLTNSVDIQHLRVLHGLEVELDLDDLDRVRFGQRSVEYDVRFRDARFGEFDQHVQVFGTNAIALSGRMMGQELHSAFAGTPQPGGRTRGFSITGVPRERRPGEPPAEQLLAMGEAFFVGLIQEDTPVMNTIRFRQDTLIPADRALARFLAYVRSYPRSHLSSEFIK